jgi:hypothetical protein
MAIALFGAIALVAAPRLHAYGVPAALAPPFELGQLRAGPDYTAHGLDQAFTGERSDERGEHDGTWFADATLDAREVASEIDRREGVILASYEHALKRRPELAGRVRFRIDEEGRVRDVAVVRDTMGDAEVADRIRAVPPTWRLPAPAHGSAIYE